MVERVQIVVWPGLAFNFLQSWQNSLKRFLSLRFIFYLSQQFRFEEIYTFWFKNMKMILK